MGKDWPPPNHVKLTTLMNQSCDSVIGGIPWHGDYIQACNFDDGQVDRNKNYLNPIARTGQILPN